MVSPTYDVRLGISGMRVYSCSSPTKAIYPTAIIVITAFNCSPLDRGLLSVDCKKDYVLSNTVRLRPRCTFCSNMPSDGSDTPEHVTRWRASESPHGGSSISSGPEMGDRDNVTVDWMAIYQHHGEPFADSDVV